MADAAVPAPRRTLPPPLSVIVDAPPPSAEWRERVRVPILDPWGEEATAAPRAASAMKSRPAPETSDDSPDVVTSAVPIVDALVRRRPSGSYATAGSAEPEAAPHGSASPGPLAPLPPSTTRITRTTPSTPPARAIPRPEVAGVPLNQVDVFVDLPVAIREHLARTARIVELAAGEPIRLTGAALVLRGDASVSASDLDAIGSRTAELTLLPARGSLAAGLALCVTARPGGATIALWSQESLDEALRSFSWILKSMTRRADRLQALAGAMTGPLRNLGDEARELLFDRVTIQAARPLEVLVDGGDAGAHLRVLGVGAIDRLGVEGAASPLRPGDALFLPTDLGARPRKARAGAGGALLLTWDYAEAAELVGGSAPVAALFA